MRRGVGCRVGGVAVQKLVIEVAFQGPTIDATLHLVDPDTNGVIGATRRVRDWPEPVRTKVQELIEAIEEAAVGQVFTDSASAGEMSIAEHLSKTEGEF